MKQQLIELMQKLNSGANVAPSVIKKIVWQYQLTHIVYLVLASVIFVISIAIMLYAVYSYAKRKSWACDVTPANKDGAIVLSPEIVEFSSIGFNVIVIAALFSVLAMVIIFISIAQVISPVYYMIVGMRWGIL